MASAFPDLYDIFIDAAESVIIIASVQRGNIHIRDIDHLLARHQSNVIAPPPPMWSAASLLNQYSGAFLFARPLKACVSLRQRHAAKTLIHGVIWKNHKAEQYLQLGDRRWHNETGAVQQRPLCWVTRRQHFSSGVKPCDDSEILNIRGISPLSLPVLFTAVISEWWANGSEVEHLAMVRFFVFTQPKSFCLC